MGVLTVVRRSKAVGFEVGDGDNVRRGRQAGGVDDEVAPARPVELWAAATAGFDPGGGGGDGIRPS